MYGFAYSLLEDLPQARDSEIDYIYAKFPWRGGYSTVNFFNQLFHKIPHTARPKVQRIQYASPGFIELAEIAAVATTAATIVKAVAYSFSTAYELYKKIQKDSVELKLSKINLAQQELKLTKEQIDFCKNSSDDLCNVLGLTPQMVLSLDNRTQGNKAIKMKLLLSVFRRARPLAELHNERLFQIKSDS
jgi:hypothetical protein